MSADDLAKIITALIYVDQGDGESVKVKCLSCNECRWPSKDYHSINLRRPRRCWVSEGKMSVV